jgi:hypothetical protein
VRTGSGGLAPAPLRDPVDRAEGPDDPPLSETRENCRAILTYSGSGAFNISHLLGDIQLKNQVDDL